MEAVAQYLAMGGYGAYVWPSYLLAGLVLGGLFLASRNELRRRERRLQELETRRGAQGGRPRRRGAAAGGDLGGGAGR
jgi:heme exporter protein D